MHSWLKFSPFGQAVLYGDGHRRSINERTHSTDRLSKARIMSNFFMTPPLPMGIEWWRRFKDHPVLLIGWWVGSLE
jgi:hypothetical protein